MQRRMEAAARHCALSSGLARRTDNAARHRYRRGGAANRRAGAEGFRVKEGAEDVRYPRERLRIKTVIDPARIVRVAAVAGQSHAAQGGKVVRDKILRQAQFRGNLTDARLTSAQQEIDMETRGASQRTQDGGGFPNRMRSVAVARFRRSGRV